MSRFRSAQLEITVAMKNLYSHPTEQAEVAGLYLLWSLVLCFTVHVIINISMRLLLLKVLLLPIAIKVLLLPIATGAMIVVIA